MVVAISLLASHYASSQDIISMGDQATVNTCGGIFTDSGGNTAGYSPNENRTFTICPDASGGGSHVQLAFSGFALPEAGDTLCFYDGPTVSAPELACSDDFLGAQTFIVQATAANPTGCLTMRFVSDGAEEGEGWSADINCTASCQNIFVELVSSDPAVMPADTGWIDACPGQRVFFEGRGLYPQNGESYNHSDFTSEFEWSFGDGTFAVGPEVSHVYDEPGGYNVQLTITDQRGCTNLNFLSQRVRVATFPDFEVGGNLPDEICVGDTVSLNASVDSLDANSVISVATTPGTFITGGVRSDSLPLPDGTGAVYETSISFSDFLPGQSLNNINDLLGICVNMEHSWMYDLDVFLECPDGTRVKLQDQEFITNEVFLGEPFTADDFNPPFPPGRGEGMTYCWTPTSDKGTWTEFAQANDPGGSGAYTLPPGNYESFAPLDNLIGCPLNGEWSIIVSDLWGSDNGWIFEWSIDFASNLFPDLETYQPQILDFEWRQTPSITSYSADSLAIEGSPQNAGTATYNFAIFDDFGCRHDTSVSFIVLPHTHPNCFDCRENLRPVSDTIICEGESVTLDVSTDNPTETSITFESIPQEPFGAATYPPSTPFESVISVNSIQPETLDSPANQIESVCLNIETNWNDDIEIYLEAPGGQLLPLSTRNGGGSENYFNTCFRPDAATAITAGTGPFTGSFQPEGNWDVLQGSPINGNWRIIASDAVGPNDIGEFISWTITFRSENEITYSWTGAGLSCTDCPAPVATPGATTTYIVNTLDSYNCAYADTITVEVVNDIPAPAVICEENEDGTITFEWQPVGSFTQYEANVILNGQSSGWTGPIPQNSYTATGLSFGDEVTVEVRVMADGALNCEVAIGSASCSYGTCSLAASLQDSPAPVSCFGESDGAATLTINNAIDPVQISLNGMPAGTDGIFTGLAAGDYEAVITDSTGCEAIVLFNIGEPEALTASIQASQLVSCNGSSNGALQASAQGGSGAYTYQWSGLPSETSSTLAGLAAGNYELTVTDASGCTATATFSLAEPDALELSLDAVGASCADAQDGQVQAMAAGGVGSLSYSWSNGASGNSLNNLPAGNYCLTVQDDNGCQASDCIELTAPEALSIDSMATSRVLCNGDATGSASAFASGGTGDYTYQWNDPLAQIGQTADMLSAGDYSVVVTDANGCQASRQASISQPEPLSIAFEAEDATCKGISNGSATAIVSGGTEPYSYNWPSGQSSASLAELSAGTYTLTATDGNGCSLESSVEIGEPDKELELTLEQSLQGCFGKQENEATATASGGTNTSGYSYLWSDGQSTAAAVGLDSLSYTVTVTDDNNCRAEATITLSDLEQIDFFIIDNLPSCYGYTDGRLGVNEIFGGAGTELADYSFSWSNGSSGPTAENLAGGQLYSVTATDSQGCSRTKSKMLQQPSEVTFQVDTDSVRCFSGQDGSASVLNVDGEFPPYAYNWSNGQQEATATNLSAGAYAVTVTDANGCFSSQTTRVAEPEPIELSFDIEDNACFGERKGSISTGVKGGIPTYNYSWGNGSSASTLENLAAGDYGLTLTDRNGCSLEATATVEEPGLLQAAIKAEDPSCHGFQDGAITIQPQGGVPPYRYSLDGEKFNGSSMQIGLKAEDYQIYVRDANGCLYTDRATLINPERFIVTTGFDSQTIELGDTIELSGFPDNEAGTPTYIWSAPYPGTMDCTECQDNRAYPQTSTLYELYGIDENGCEYVHRFHIYVNKTRTVLVPTGFTPNNDGTNDRLLVHGKEGTLVKKFQIYDRWGELLFQDGDFPVNSESHGWDGSFRGQPLNGGVYIWYLVVEYEDGMEDAFQGQSTLIK